MSQRAFTRVNYLVRASIQYGNTVVTGHTDNLSLRGMFMETDSDIPLKVPVNVSVDYRSRHSSFNFNAKVVRKEKNGVGLQIHKISADSFARLRDIVNKNCVDSGKVMNETFSMLKCIY
jgi:hypothetical protein